MENNNEKDMTNTNQLDKRDNKGRFAPGYRSPAGFDKHPENRSDGGWKKEDSISYQYNMLIRLSIDKFKKWLIDNPEDKRTMAQELAYQAVLNARKNIQYLKEVTDRIEGKAKQSIEHNIDNSITDILKGLNNDDAKYADELTAEDTNRIIEKQKLANEPSIQDQGQTGQFDNLQAQSDAEKIYKGQEESPLQPVTQG